VFFTHTPSTRSRTMSRAPETPTLPTAAPPAPDLLLVPPLENGDRLTRAEFELRYSAMPELKKAELVEGVVHMPSPVRFEQHGEQHVDLVGWVAVYRVHTPGV